MLHKYEEIVLIAFLFLASSTVSFFPSYFFFFFGLKQVLFLFATQKVLLTSLNIHSLAFYRSNYMLIIIFWYEFFFYYKKRYIITLNQIIC